MLNVDPYISNHLFLRGLEPENQCENSTQDTAASSNWSCCLIKFIPNTKAMNPQTTYYILG